MSTSGATSNTPNQQKEIDTSQNSNFYMNQMGQGGHSEITMISNTNVSKSQYSNNVNAAPNLKRPTPVYNDDDTDEPASNKSKIHQQMANTGYEGGFGGGNGAPMKSYYQ